MGVKGKIRLQAGALPGFLTIHLLQQWKHACLLRCKPSRDLEVFQYAFARAQSCALHPRMFQPFRDDVW